MPTPFASYQSTLAVHGTRVFLVASGPDVATTVVAIDIDSGKLETLRAPDGPPIDKAYHSIPEHITFDTPDGPAYALFYPPVNPDYTGPAGEAPPIIVEIHGGPSSSTSARLDPEGLFWTSRGIGILDVDHGGSTAAGRDFRRRLDGQWGVVDVRDCALAAAHLAAIGKADPKKLMIHGGSAGGFTTLLALALHDDFASGASYYGVTDLEALATDTHKFESRYLDRLVGPYPERRDLYVERSPITHVDKIRVPLLLLQGLEDEVVPVSQARSMRDALIANGVPVGYLEVAGEGHGFPLRRARTRALEAEACGSTARCSALIRPTRSNPWKSRGCRRSGVIAAPEGVSLPWTARDHDLKLGLLRQLLGAFHHDVLGELEGQVEVGWVRWFAD